MPSAAMTTLLDPHAQSVEVVHDLAGFSRLRHPDCAAVLWQRRLAPDLQAWLDGLLPEQLPTGRLVAPARHVSDVLYELCTRAGTPAGPARRALLEDISALAQRFAEVMTVSHLRLRLDAVSNNACRKFHVDAMVARLVCTYRGAATQYGLSTDGSDPAQIRSVPTGAPLLMRGSLWPETPRSGFVHRSPHIEGSGQTRLLLVLDPIFDPAEA